MPDPATAAVIIIGGALIAGHWIACIRDRRQLRRECEELKRLYGGNFGDWWNRR